MSINVATNYHAAEINLRLDVWANRVSERLAQLGDKTAEPATGPAVLCGLVRRLVSRPPRPPPSHGTVATPVSYTHLTLPTIYSV